MRYLIETTDGVILTDDDVEAQALEAFLGDRFVSACGKGHSRHNPTFQMTFPYPERKQHEPES